MNILVTGGCGFIGSNFINHVLHERKAWKVTNYDALTYAGNPENLKNVEGNSNYRFFVGRIEDGARVDDMLRSTPYGAIINFAAESHVDRSLKGAQKFARTNLEGTVTLLDAARRHKVGRFVQISTDEVYGSLDGDGVFTEETPLHPNNPYAASKTAADLMVLSYVHTFEMNAVITRSSNNYGIYQYPEKFIPVCITQALSGQKIPVYGDGLQIRDWLNVQDHCRGILMALEAGRKGEVYNFGGSNEKSNLYITSLILKELGLSTSQIEHVPDRLGHDRRYAVGWKKAFKELGWRPIVPFDMGLAYTVDWYRTNGDWIKSCLLKMDHKE